jgi:ribose-phosphate pyrophosphokinase
MADAAFSSAGRVTAVIPYFGYQCQERKPKPRTPESAKIVARLLSHVGFHRIVLFEPHSDAMTGFFSNAKIEVAYATPVIIEYLLNCFTAERMHNLIVAAADTGGGKKAQVYYKRLRRAGYEVCFGGAHKTGTSSEGVEDIMVIGNFKGRDVVTIEDMVRTGATSIRHAKMVRDAGASSYILVAFHPVLVSLAKCEELAACKEIDRVVVTDTLPISPEKMAALGDKLVQLSVTRLFAKLIHHLHYDESISALLEYEGYMAA